VISNPGTGLTVTNLIARDLLPSGWTYVTTTQVSLNNGATRPISLTPTFGDVTPTWGRFTLPPTNSSVVIDFIASVPLGQTCSQVLSNVVNTVYSRGGNTQTSSYIGTDPGLTSDDVTIRCPQVGAAKSLLSLTDNGNGSFSLEYGLKFRNSGDEALTAVTVSDPLASAQGGNFGVLTASNPPAVGQYRIASAPALFGACPGMTAQAAYNGAASLAVASGSMAVGLECEVRFTVQMGPTSTFTVYNNQANVTATGNLSAVVVSDFSDDGVNAEPSNNNGTGTTNDPTPAVITPSAQLSLSKTNAVSELVAGQTVDYVIEIGNDGPSGVLGANLRDTHATGLQCVSASCVVTSGTAICPVVGAGAGELSVANLQGTGVSIPRLDTGSRLQITITCGVTATGLP
jgi:uncharacterized repeat protein (TIGR01451 family)